MTNVPIPGRSSTHALPPKRQAKPSRNRFFIAVAILAVSGAVSVLLALGEPWNLAPDLASSIMKSSVAVALTFLLVVPAFAVFQYERSSAGRGWHEPAWRPSTIGILGLMVSIGTLIGWHGLRLAILLAREWSKVFG